MIFSFLTIYYYGLVDFTSEVVYSNYGCDIYCYLWDDTQKRTSSWDSLFLLWDEPIKDIVMEFILLLLNKPSNKIITKFIIIIVRWVVKEHCHRIG